MFFRIGIVANVAEACDAEIKEVEKEIAEEGTRYPVLSVEKVKLFLEQFAKGDIKDFYFREKLIEIFVKEIKVYNDKITVSYNVQDGYFFDYSTIFFNQTWLWATKKMF